MASHVSFGASRQCPESKCSSFEMMIKEADTSSLVVKRGARPANPETSKGLQLRGGTSLADPHLHLLEAPRTEPFRGGSHQPTVATLYPTYTKKRATAADGRLQARLSTRTITSRITAPRVANKPGLPRQGHRRRHRQR